MHFRNDVGLQKKKKIKKERKGQVKDFHSEILKVEPRTIDAQEVPREYEEELYFVGGRLWNSWSY